MDIRLLTEINNRPQKVKQTYKIQNRFLEVSTLSLKKIFTCLVFLSRAERDKQVANTFKNSNPIEVLEGRCRKEEQQSP